MHRLRDTRNKENDTIIVFRGGDGFIGENKIHLHFIEREQVEKGYRPLEKRGGKIMLVVPANKQGIIQVEVFLALAATPEECCQNCRHSFTTELDRINGEK